jgi:gluconokinase
MAPASSSSRLRATIASFNFTPYKAMDAMTQNSVPRSAYDRTGGIVYFARMLDKIRLRAAGSLRADFHANLGSGFDGRCCRFLGIDYSALRDRVLSGGTDDEILQWCFSQGTRPSDEQVLTWNKARLARRGRRCDSRLGAIQSGQWFGSPSRYRDLFRLF